MSLHNYSLCSFTWCTLRLCFVAAICKINEKNISSVIVHRFDSRQRLLSYKLILRFVNSNYYCQVLIIFPRGAPASEAIRPTYYRMQLVKLTAALRCYGNCLHDSRRPSSRREISTRLKEELIVSYLCQNSQVTLGYRMIQKSRPPSFFVIMS